MPDSDPSPTDAALERLDDEITFLVDSLRDVSDSLADLAFRLDAQLTESDHEQVRITTDRLAATLNNHLTNDLTALVGLGAIRHGAPAEVGTVDDEIPTLTATDLPPLSGAATGAATGGTANGTTGGNATGATGGSANGTTGGATGTTTEAETGARLVAAEHLRRLAAFVGSHFDLARLAAEHGNAERAMSEYRLARQAAHSAPEAYRLWLGCLSEPGQEHDTGPD
ncbi:MULTISPECIES: hypothetical protein [Micromonospora]|uniref:Uncharacterized protein n=1 Tax=Micromonospora yangpuensis TaxID=683228 RepID=A0A1C6UZ43_9ACTN|nr:hypothetical protein [Micromonospora yangpuensis]GGL96017.1 hypothetical protein GCM10012279_11800 [Micromonospora yangpuensis]SCL59345.1 hypothetical protein GA0070617_4078 [Micromonospora yangpuensis]